jgi:hypothetical protein
MLWSNFWKKLAVVWAKNANIFAKFFGKNIFKIITSVPVFLLPTTSALRISCYKCSNVNSRFRTKKSCGELLFLNCDALCSSNFKPSGLIEFRLCLKIMDGCSISTWCHLSPTMYLQT